MVTAVVLMLVLVVVTVKAPLSAFAAETAPIGLGVAGTYSVLGGEAVSNTGTSVLDGDLGVSPGSAITGFPPGIVRGARHAADAEAAAAQAALVTAYDDAEGRDATATYTDDPHELGGGTPLVPGVYKSNVSAQLTGNLTLDGQGKSSSVWIFQIGSTLTTASHSNISLTNGALACNVFWQVGSSATIGSDTHFVGTVLAKQSITANTNAYIDGRLLAEAAGAVSLDTNVFESSACGAGPSPTVTETATVTATPVATETVTGPTTTVTATPTATETVTGPTTTVTGPTTTVTGPTATETVTETVGSGTPTATETVTGPTTTVTGPTTTVTGPTTTVTGPTTTVTGPTTTVTATPTETVTETASPSVSVSVSTTTVTAPGTTVTAPASTVTVTATPTATVTAPATTETVTETETETSEAETTGAETETATETETETETETVTKTKTETETETSRSSRTVLADTGVGPMTNSLAITGVALLLLGGLSLLVARRRARAQGRHE